MSYPQQPQQAPPQAPAPAKRRRRWPWITLGALAVIIAIAVATNPGATDEPGGVPAGNEANAPADQAAEQDAAAAEHAVVYRVTGSGTALSITYTTDGMTTTNQESDVKLPWEKTIKLPTGEAMQLVSIVAQGANESTVLDVVIEVDGKQFKEAHAEGYGVATANGNIGTMG